MFSVSSSLFSARCANISVYLNVQTYMRSALPPGGTCRGTHSAFRDAKTRRIPGTPACCAVPADGTKSGQLCVLNPPPFAEDPFACEQIMDARVKLSREAKDPKGPGGGPGMPTAATGVALWRENC